MSATKVNWKAIIIYIILIALIIIAICYFIPSSMWKTNPIKAFVDGIVAKTGIASFFQGSTGQQVTGVISKNWQMIAGFSAVLIPMGIAYVKSYLAQKQAKKELADAQQLIVDQKAASDLKFQAMQKTISGYESDTTADDLQKNLSGVLSEKELMQKQILKLQGQVDQLPKLQSQVINELWQNSGGKVVEIAGEKVKIIEMTTVTVK